MLILLFFRLFLLLKKTTLRKQILYKLLILYYRKNTLFIIFPYSLPVFYIHSSKKKIAFIYLSFVRSQCSISMSSICQKPPKSNLKRATDFPWMDFPGFHYSLARKFEKRFFVPTARSASVGLELKASRRKWMEFSPVRGAVVGSSVFYSSPPPTPNWKKNYLS